MDIFIIGTGNVATILAKLIYKSPLHNILGIAGRNDTAGKDLARSLSTNFYQPGLTSLPLADITIIATSDESLTKLEASVFPENSFLVHTAGAVSKNVLEKYSSEYGVLYPLQSLRKELIEIPLIPFLIDANSEANIEKLQNFCNSISAPYQTAGDEERLAMHTAAVVVNNFTNHLYTLAEKFCKSRGVDFKMLFPLITETTHRLENSSPEFLQTGPAIRRDLVTINKHLALLDEDPQLKEIYKLLSESIAGK